MLQLHPACTLRFAGPLPTLHNAQIAGSAVELPDAGTVALLASFARPQAPADVLARMPEAARPRLQALLDTLRERGLLVAPETLREGPLQAAPEGYAQMAQALHGLALESACLPQAEREACAAPAQAALAAFDGLRRGLRAAHDRQAQQRLAALTPPTGGWRLHLGAGGLRLEGWLGIDADPEAELPLNLAGGLPFADASVRYIYAAHVLEHLYYPGEVQRLLAECRRVLQPEGRLRLVVPDIGQCLEAYAAGDSPFFAARRAHWPHWPAGRTPLEDFLAYAGAGSDPGQALHAHKYGYDAQTLQAALQRAGFGQTERCAYTQGPEPELLLDAHSFAAQATHAQGHYSLFVEARP